MWTAQTTRLSSFPEDSSDLFHRVFDSSYDFIGLLSLSGTLLEANKPALDFINSSADQVMYKPFWDTPWWSHSKSLQKKLIKAIKTAVAGKSIHFEAMHRGPTGREINVDFTLQPLKDSSGSVIYLLAEGRDISDRVQLEHLKDEFLHAAVHELRTPLTVLKLLTQSHMNKINGLDSIDISKDHLYVIDSELTRVINLINDLSDSSRIQNNHLYLNKTLIPLRDIVVNTLKEMQIYATKHKIVVDEFDDVYVHVDANRIKQVLVNLITNAIKYSGDGTTITIKTKTERNRVVVSIQDEGIGIPVKLQKKIFDKFYQIQYKTSKGVGLGLFISREIIRRHHGSMWVSSAPGKGSTFYFSLPLRGGE